MLGGKKISIISIVTFLTIGFFILIPHVVSDTSNGSVIINSTAPSVTAIALPSSTDVDVYFYINATVSDDNTLNDIDNITFYIYNSNYSAWDGTDNVTDHFTLTYINSTDTWTSSPSGYVDSANSIEPSDKTVVSGDYKAYFKFSTVSQYVGAYWYVKAKATDNDANEGTMTSTAFEVNKYFSLDISETDFNFGSVNPGTDDIEIADPAAHYLTITAVTNYNYTMQLSRSSWNSLDSKFTITRDAGDGTEIKTSAADWKTNQDAPSAEAGTTHQLYLFLDVATGVPDTTYTFTLTATIASI
jgi:hypothetical protein